MHLVKITGINGAISPDANNQLISTKLKITVNADMNIDRPTENITHGCIATLSIKNLKILFKLYLINKIFYYL